MTTTSLPFKLEAQPVAVQHAYENFVAFYGKKDGTRIFLQKAEEQGKGNTIREKVLSIYSKGSHISEPPTS